MVHGFMGGSRQWDLQRSELDKHLELITPDLPGFGLNAHLEAPGSIEGFAKFVLETLDAQSVSSFDLLGHSMGGMIVQEMLALASERINKLVIYGSASTGNLPNRFEPFETSRQRIKTDGPVASARRISATWFLNHETASEYENCASIAERATLQAMMAGLDAMESWSRTNNLPNINCPTLIVWGEKDRTYGWQQIEHLWTTIPNASLAVMPGCSHAAHLEKPQLFNSIVKDFVA